MRFMRVFDTFFHTFEEKSAKWTDCRTCFAVFLENLPHFRVHILCDKMTDCGNFVAIATFQTHCGIYVTVLYFYHKIIFTLFEKILSFWTSISMETKLITFAMFGKILILNPIYKYET